MVDKVLFSSQSSEWQTPLSLFEKINNIWPIDLDPCTTEGNHLFVPHFYTKKDNGLQQDWSFAEGVFVNPPYNRSISNWLWKAIHEMNKPESKIRHIVFLLPARTDTKWFHRFIYDDFILKFHPHVENVWFIRGRLKFGNSKNSAPFPSMVVIFTKPQK